MAKAVQRADRQTHHPIFKCNQHPNIYTLMSRLSTTSVTSPSSPVASNGFFNSLQSLETKGMRPNLYVQT